MRAKGYHYTDDDDNGMMTTAANDSEEEDGFFDPGGIQPGYLFGGKSGNSTPRRNGHAGTNCRVLRQQSSLQTSHQQQQPYQHVQDGRNMLFVSIKLRIFNEHNYNSSNIKFQTKVAKFSQLKAFKNVSTKWLSLYPPS